MDGGNPYSKKNTVEQEHIVKITNRRHPIEFERIIKCPDKGMGRINTLNINYKVSANFTGDQIWIKTLVAQAALIFGPQQTRIVLVRNE